MPAKGRGTARIAPGRARAAAASLFALALLTAPADLAATQNKPSRLAEEGGRLNLTKTPATGKDGLIVPAERSAFPLARYEVRDDSAGYFDVETRREVIRARGTPGMKAQAEQLRLAQSCAKAMSMPVMAHKIQLPGFYPSPDRWRQAAQPFFAFEDAVTKLAGWWAVTGDRHPAQCLVRLLAKWAEKEAFLRFAFAEATPQGWFAIESSLFAAGLAYSTVHGFAERRMPAEAAKVEAWLNDASHKHLSKVPNAPSCCNNHFYRRALHATVNGIVSEDDALFRYGVSAIYAALHEANPDGSLPRELMRGRRAVHYHNYANVYLTMIAQLVQRQGYAIYGLEVKGRSLHTLARYAVGLMREPARIDRYTRKNQNFGFMSDSQYFAWMEIYLADFPNPEMRQLLEPRRPTYNRSAGGFLTLYFHDPEPGDAATAQTLVEVGNAFVSESESCAQDPRWHQDRDIEWRRECERTLRDQPAGNHATGADIYREQLSGEGAR